MISISKNLTEILKRIEDVHRLAPCASPKVPRLVAVSKEKPISAIIEAYNAGQRAFGENRIASLLEKSAAPEVIVQCPNIEWHFIGNIQSNKITKLASKSVLIHFYKTDVLNLSVIETLDSLPHAVLLDSAWKKMLAVPLHVMVQVNTSGELQKGGVDPSDLVELYKSITISCSRLKIIGLMCIGRSGHDDTVEPNPDFLLLSNCRKDLCGEMGIETSELELSMGMSDDFEHAGVQMFVWGLAYLVNAHIKAHHDRMDQKAARFRVTGSMLPNLVGRDVCVLGTALSVSSNGKSIHLRCVDGCEIDANLLSPLQSSPENCIVEVQGRVRNPQANELDATAEPIIFSKEASDKFDTAMYTQAIQLTAQLDRFYLQVMES